MREQVALRRGLAGNAIASAEAISVLFGANAAYFAVNMGTHRRNHRNYRVRINQARDNMGVIVAPYGGGCAEDSRPMRRTRSGNLTAARPANFDRLQSPGVKKIRWVFPARRIDYHRHDVAIRKGRPAYWGILVGQVDTSNST